MPALVAPHIFREESGFVECLARWPRRSFKFTRLSLSTGPETTVIERETIGVRIWLHPRKLSTASASLRLRRAAHVEQEHALRQLFVKATKRLDNEDNVPALRRLKMNKGLVVKHPAHLRSGLGTCCPTYPQGEQPRAFKSMPVSCSECESRMSNGVDRQQPLLNLRGSLIDCRCDKDIS